MARSPAEIQADIAVTRRVIERQLDALGHAVEGRWWAPYAVVAGSASARARSRRGWPWPPPSSPSTASWRTAAASPARHDVKATMHMRNRLRAAER